MVFYMGHLLNFEAPGLFFANRRAYVRLLLYQHQDPYQIFRLSYAEVDLYQVLTRPPRLQMRISISFLQELYYGKELFKIHWHIYIHLNITLQKSRFLQVLYYQVFDRFSFFLLIFFWLCSDPWVLCALVYISSEGLAKNSACLQLGLDTQNKVIKSWFRQLTWIEVTCDTYLGEKNKKNT